MVNIGTELYGHGVRDGHFSEIYHPETDERYGGWQEWRKGGNVFWESEKKQTWSATGYLHMIFCDILGIRVFSDRIEVAPWLPDDINMLHISNLHIRNIALDIKVERDKNDAKSIIIPYEAENKEISVCLTV